MSLVRWAALSCLWVTFLPLGQAQEKLGEDMVNPGYHEQPAWFKTSFLDIGEDISEAAAEDKRLILYFYQDGCPYCKKLLEVNFAQKDIVDKTRARFDVVSINMWGDREVTAPDGRTLSEKRFAEDMRVMFTPTLLFFDENGKVVLRVNGYYPPHKFKTALDYVAGRHEGRSSFREYFTNIDPPPAAGKLHAEPYLMQPPYDLKSKRRPDRYLMVLFEQKECPACDELHGDILARKETKELVAPFDVVQLDMWSKAPVMTPDGKKTTAAAWAEALDIKYAPSLVFFDKAGKEVFRTEAYLKAFHVQSVLDYVATSAFKRQPHFQRYIEERADGLREKGITVDLMR